MSTALANNTDTAAVAPTLLSRRGPAQTLDDLAARINEQHRLCQTAAQSAVGHAIRAGGLLIEAKRHCAHGQWSEWLTDNCGLPDLTARLYMRLAREVPALPEAKRQRVADLSLRGVTKLITEHQQERRKAERLAEAVMTAPRTTVAVTEGSSKARVIRTYRDGEGGRMGLVVEVAPNEAGIKLVERIEALKQEPAYARRVKRVSALRAKADDLERQLAQLQRQAGKARTQANRNQRVLREAIRKELESRHGPPVTHYERDWHEVTDADVAERLRTMDDEELIEYINDALPAKRGTNRGIRHWQFSWGNSPIDDELREEDG